MLNAPVIKRNKLKIKQKIHITHSMDFVFSFHWQKISPRDLQITANKIIMVCSWVVLSKFVVLLVRN